MNHESGPQGPHLFHTGEFMNIHNPVMDTIMKRRSVRTYKDIPVDWGKVINCVEAGMMAPSSGNLQIWRFSVVRGASKKSAIASACLQQHWMEQAPVHIAIFAKHDRAEQFYRERGSKIYCVQDCAMAAMNIMIAAESIGLSTCFVSAFDEQAMSRIFSLPDKVTPQGVITLGYSDETPDAPSRYRVETLVGVENYGTAMNEGGGRVADGNAAVWNFRYAQRFPNYVKDAASDISKATREDRENLVTKVKGFIEKLKEK